ncbi:MAG TPA: hypothetical protein VJL29_03005 [Thermoguttaceae bacterium]|nr:hypothetical protein [Thermoguttaceae bacterium]
MQATVQKTMEHFGECRGCDDHVHDLIQTLGRCLNGLWRYDQYIANADGHPELQQFWREFREQELASVSRMKELLANDLRQECS